MGSQQKKTIRKRKAFYKKRYSKKIRHLNKKHILEYPFYKQPTIDPIFHWWVDRKKAKKQKHKSLNYDRDCKYYNNYVLSYSP